MIYSERVASYYDGEVDWPNYGVTMETIVGSLSYNYESTDYMKHLLGELDGIPVNLTNDRISENSDYARSAMLEPEQLTWLSDFIDSANELKDHMIAYGNEVTLGCIYLNPCLIIPFPLQATARRLAPIVITFLGLCTSTALVSAGFSLEQVVDNEPSIPHRPPPILVVPREIPCRPLCLIILFWISATILGSRTWSAEGLEIDNSIGSGR